MNKGVGEVSGFQYQNDRMLVAHSHMLEIKIHVRFHISDHNLCPFI